MEMIYDFSIHALYYDTQDILRPNFSLALDTLELVFDMQTDELLRIQGFLSLVQASIEKIQLPPYENGSFLLNGTDLSMCKENEVYDMVKIIPRVKRYFEKMKSDLNLSDKINLENIKSEVNVNIRSFFKILEFSITKFDENGRLKYNVFRLSFPKLKELYEKEFLQTVKTEEANDEIIKNNNNNRGTLSNILNSLDGLLAHNSNYESHRFYRSSYIETWQI